MKTDGMRRALQVVVGGALASLMCASPALAQDDPTGLTPGRQGTSGYFVSELIDSTYFVGPAEFFAVLSEGFFELGGDSLRHRAGGDDQDAGRPVLGHADGVLGGADHVARHRRVHLPAEIHGGGPDGG